MCPEPALLVAYLDGALFHRDAHEIDIHLEGCASCIDLVAAMRRHRAAEERSRRAQIWRRAGIAVFAVALLAIGGWTLVTRSRPPALASTFALRATADESRAPAKQAPPSQPSGTSVQETPPSLASRATAKQAPPSLASRATAKQAPPSFAPRLTTPQVAGRPEPRTMWRVRDRVIEQSTDAGATWLADYTADRNIRASAFVSADVGWIVGDNGLVLRRTKNGWFDATPPANATITAVRASSPSKATVTLDDGRVFTTVNGGVTWTPP